MGFFKDFKDDFSQAINELLPGEDYSDNDEIQVNTLGDELDVEKELSKLDGLLEQVEKRSEQAQPSMSEKSSTGSFGTEKLKTADLASLDDLEDDDWEMPQIQKLDTSALESEAKGKQADVLEFQNRSRHSASKTAQEEAASGKAKPRFVTPKTDLPELDDEWDDLDLFDEPPKTSIEKKVPDFLNIEHLAKATSAFDKALDRELDKELQQEKASKKETKKEVKKEVQKEVKKDAGDETAHKTDASAADLKQADTEKKLSAEHQLDRMQKELEKKEREKQELAKKEFERKEAEKKAFEQRELEKKEREKREQQKRELEKLEEKLEKDRLDKQMQEFDVQNKASKADVIDNGMKKERIREEQKMDAMMTGVTETTTSTMAAEPVEKKVSMEAVDGDVTEEVSLITAGTKIRGNMETTGSFEIEGTIEGDIKCNGKLTVIGRVVGNSSASEFFADAAHVEGEVLSTGTVKVGLGSVIIGNIAATSAVIAGAVKGDIDVQGPVVVDTSAVIMGNIKSRSVQINNGAVIEGFCSQSYSDVDVESLFSNKNK